MITRAKLANLLAELCPRHRIDLAGAISLPCELPLGDRFEAWLAEDRHGDLEYMKRAPQDRRDPTRRNPEARSLLVFAQRYTDGWAADPAEVAAGGAAPADAPWTGRVARYARGQDYHDVLRKDITALLRDLATDLPGLTAHASTDTGPYLEREYAWLAGLGFLGKNTCLIHERLGSGLFLGVALANLEIEGLPAAGRPAVAPLYGAAARRTRPPAQGYLSACGSCTRCVEACPTGAIGPDGGLDAGRCLSTFTIERKGQTPEEFGAAQGGILFGCDICQAVCPWNGRAAGMAEGLPAVRPQYGVLAAHAELDLPALARISNEEFRLRLRPSPLWRCHPDGLRRNAETVLANLGKGES